MRSHECGSGLLRVATPCSSLGHPFGMTSYGPENFVRGSADLRQRSKGGHRSRAATPDRGDKQIAEFPFGEVLDGKFSDDLGVFAAQGAAGLFHLFGHHSLARFKVGEAFTVGLLGHVHRSFDGLPAVPFIGRLQAACNPRIGRLSWNRRFPCAVR